MTNKYVKNMTCPEYRSWAHMIQRCRHDKRYVNRKISVHPSWQGSGGFDAFIADMGPRPSLDHSIDRINNDGNYEPGNCRWATELEQHNNTSSNVIIEAFGKRQTISEWSREYNINYKTLSNRLHRGNLPPELALTLQNHTGKKSGKDRFSIDDLETMIAYRFLGYKYEEIAKIVGSERHVVSKAISRYSKLSEGLPEIRDDDEQ